VADSLVLAPGVSKAHGYLKVTLGLVNLKAIHLDKRGAAFLGVRAVKLELVNDLSHELVALLLLERLAAEGTLIVLHVDSLLDNPLFYALFAELILARAALCRVLQDHKANLTDYHRLLLRDKSGESDVVQREEERLIVPHWLLILGFFHSFILRGVFGPMV
jgi:hypothetical protein